MDIISLLAWACIDDRSPISRAFELLKNHELHVFLSKRTLQVSDYHSFDLVHRCLCCTVIVKFLCDIKRLSMRKSYTGRVSLATRSAQTKQETLFDEEVEKRSEVYEPTSTLPMLVLLFLPGSHVHQRDQSLF